MNGRSDRDGDELSADAEMQRRRAFGDVVGDDEMDYHPVFHAESRRLGSNVYKVSVLPWEVLVEELACLDGSPKYAVRGS